MKKTKMLKKNYEFKDVLNRGKYYSGKYIIIYIKKNRKNINLLGIAISSKLGKAVKRNYLKRLIRENYRKIENSIKTGYSMVFLWKKNQEIDQANYKNVEKDIKKIFEEAEIFIEKN